MNILNNNTTYKIPLLSSDLDYGSVTMISEREHWDEEDPYVVVLLDIDKVRNLAEQGGQRWPYYPNSWEESKYEVFVDALDPSRSIYGIVNLPRISPSLLRNKDDSFLDMLCVYFQGEKYVITFGNGRHRTEFLRINGVKAMPFETRKSFVNILERECGV